MKQLQIVLNSTEFRFHIKSNHFFILSSIALTLSALFLIFCAYFGRTKFTALFLLSVGVGAGGLQIAGHPVGIIDMAPRFSGVIMGFMNLAGTIPGIIGPIIAKSIANAVS